MSEFDAFEGAAPAAEDDPAADFLAREQNQMAELEGDGFGAEAKSEPADANLFGGDSDGFTGASAEGDGGMLDAFAAPDAAAAAAADIEPIALDTEVSQPEPSGYEAISSVDKQRKEPEKIRKWREDQKIRLEEKDAESEKKRAEWREVAKKELEDWYKHKDEQLEKNFKLNRESEKVFIEERDEDIPGGEWERICRLCEFQPKASRNQKDVSRMRSILLQLKQTPLTRA